jgi:hypothetical protein
VDRGICEDPQGLDNDGGLRSDGTQKGLIFDWSSVLASFGQKA